MSLFHDDNDFMILLKPTHNGFHIKCSGNIKDYIYIDGYINGKFIPSPGVNYGTWIQRMILKLYYDNTAERPYGEKFWHFVLYSFDLLRIKMKQVYTEDIYTQKLGHFVLISMLQFWKVQDQDFEKELMTEEQIRKGSVPNAR